MLALFGGASNDKEIQGGTMIKKMVIVIAAGALAFGLSASAASVKHSKPHHAKQPAAATTGAAKNAPKAEAIKGNKPMGVSK
jgi:hypothetical protein